MKFSDTWLCNLVNDYNFPSPVVENSQEEESSDEFFKVFKHFIDTRRASESRIKHLMVANRILINETKEELTRTITESKQEMYLPREKVLEMLGISPTTLWRWQQCGYLVPISVGGQNRFKFSDINKILGGGG